MLATPRFPAATGTAPAAMAKFAAMRRPRPLVSSLAAVGRAQPPRRAVLAAEGAGA